LSIGFILSFILSLNACSAFCHRPCRTRKPDEIVVRYNSCRTRSRMHDYDCTVINTFIYPSHYVTYVIWF